MYIEEEKFLNQLFYQPSLNKKGQSLESATSFIKSKIDEFVKENYDPERKTESLLAFITPALLWMTGFRWFALGLEVAVAAGFDLKGFFSKITGNIKPALSKSESSGVPVDPSEVDDAVQSAVEESFSNSPDEAKTLEMAKKSFATTSFNDMLVAKGALQDLEKDYLVSNAGLAKMIWDSLLGKQVKKGIIGMIAKTTASIIKLALLSFGFAAGGKSAKQVAEKVKEKVEETESDKAGVKLVLNTSAPQELFEYHKNDDLNVFVLDGSSSLIKQKLINWAKQLYPQLQSADFSKSSHFNETVAHIAKRNQGAETLNLTIIPPPFTSIRSIVDSFAADVALYTGKPNA